MHGGYSVIGRVTSGLDQLTADGYLSRYRTFAASEPDMTGVADEAGDALQPRDLRAGLPPQRLEELALSRFNAVRRAEHTLLVLLEGRRHEALRTGQRLAALIVGGYEVLVRVRDLDVVPEDAVEADLERVDAGALALLALDARNAILPAIPQRTQLVDRRGLDGLQVTRSGAEVEHVGSVRDRPTIR